MQYSLITHGTALEIETPGALASNIKVGWGTQTGQIGIVHINADSPGVDWIELP